MEVEYMPEAIKDIQYFKRSGDKKLMKKIQSLIFEMQDSPKKGTGKPEQLKNNLSGYWSRRINREHRIIYKIDENRNIITIYSMRGHY
jgi:toxin YoeB